MITSLDELPSDVFDEAILSHLRLTTLLAVKCVSREWAAAARARAARPAVRDVCVHRDAAAAVAGQIFNSDAAGRVAQRAALRRSTPIPERITRSTATSRRATASASAAGG